MGLVLAVVRAVANLVTLPTSEGREDNLYIDTKGRLHVAGYPNASAIAFGSAATSTSAAALGGATAYTGGIILSNPDTSITIWIGKTSGVAAAVGAGNFPLTPGASLVIPVGDLSAIFAIVTSGTPTIAWIGLTA